jgi:type I restriction enzyme S subunit
MIWQKVFYNNISVYISLINKELEKGFSLEPLSNRIKVQGGYAFKANEYRSEGVPVIRISDFQNERIDLSTVKYYKEDKSFDKFQLFPGDIIIAMTGGTIGKLAIVQEGLGKLYLNQRVGKFVILDKNEFEPEYVYWLARGIQNKVQNLGYGGAQPNVSNGQIEALQFPFPERKIQRKIVEYLNDLRDNKIQSKLYFNESVETDILNYQMVGVNLFTVLDECEQQETYLQQLRQVILQEAVQGKLTKQDQKDEPADELLQRIKAEKQKLIAAGKLKKEKELPPITEDEIPYKLPKGWAWCRLGEAVLKITDGFHNTPPRVNEGYPYVLATHIKEYGIDFENCSYVSERFHRELWTKAYPQKGEILLVNIGAGCGTPSIIDVDFEFSFKNSAIIKQPKEINTKFLFNYLISIKEKVYNEITQGGAQPYLSLKMINNLLFPLPPIPEQQRIVAKVKQLMEMINRLDQQVQQSKEQASQLLQAVLKEAFTDKKQYEENDVMTLAAEK